MAKKTSSNAVKKIDRQLNQLLKEKKEIDDIPVKEQKEVLQKIKEEDKKKKSTPKKISSKKEAIVVKDRTTNTKKDAIVVKERKNTTNKKSSSSKKTTQKKKTTPSKRSISMDTKTKKTLQEKHQKKTKVSESTLKMQKLETEMRSLYDKVSDIVEDVEDQKYVKTAKQVDEVMISDVEKKKEEEIIEKEGWTVLSIITLVLSIIFTVLFIAFIVFLIYICTY